MFLTLGGKQGLCGWRARPAIEAQNFLAAVYGAMLAARAFNDPGKFSAIVDAFVVASGAWSLRPRARAAAKARKGDDRSDAASPCMRLCQSSFAGARYLCPISLNRSVLL